MIPGSCSVRTVVVAAAAAVVARVAGANEEDTKQLFEFCSADQPEAVDSMVSLGSSTDDAA